MKEYKNGLGVAYRGLEQTAEELETLLDKGETRMSVEEIAWRKEALISIEALSIRISMVLNKFLDIAPPPVRTEPPKEPQE